MKNKTLFRLLLIALGLTIGFAAYIPIYAALYPPQSIKDYRLSHPAPYANSPYWSPEFVMEFDKVKSHLTVLGYWQVDDYAGRWYNFKDGFRHVSNQPQRYERTVWLFGNSALMGVFVPDDYTIAHYLQAEMPAVRVVSAATAGQFVSGEYIWLRQVDVRPGDAVVFYDGSMVSDAAHDQHYVDLARIYTLGRGANFVHVLQATNSPENTPIRGDVDLSRLVPLSDFIDWPHPNEVGNQIVAQALRGIILGLPAGILSIQQVGFDLRFQLGVDKTIGPSSCSKR